MTGGSFGLFFFFTYMLKYTTVKHVCVYKCDLLVYLFDFLSSVSIFKREIFKCE